MVLTFDVSTTLQAMSFGDSGGQIHLFSTTDEPVFNTYSRQTEFPDPPIQYPSFAIDDYSTPLSSIPMIYSQSDLPLASDLPPHLTKFVYRYVSNSMIFLDTSFHLSAFCTKHTILKVLPHQ